MGDHCLCAGTVGLITLTGRYTACLFQITSVQDNVGNTEIADVIMLKNQADIS